MIMILKVLKELLIKDCSINKMSIVQPVIGMGRIKNLEKERERERVKWLNSFSYFFALLAL